MQCFVSGKRREFWAERGERTVCAGDARPEAGRRPPRGVTRKERAGQAGFAVGPQAVKVTATVRDKGWVRTERRGSAQEDPREGGTAPRSSPGGELPCLLCSVSRLAVDLALRRMHKPNSSQAASGRKYMDCVGSGALVVPRTSPGSGKCPRRRRGRRYNLGDLSLPVSSPFSFSNINSNLNEQEQLMSPTIL